MKGNFSLFALEIANLYSETNEYKKKFLKDFLENIKEILILPEKILKIYDELINNDENNDLNIDKYLIDIIFEFYSIFKKRYEELRENDFTIIPNSIKKDDIIKRSDYLLKNYFKFNKSNIFISNFGEPFKEINLELLKLKNIPSNSVNNKSRAIIIKEGNIALMSENTSPDFSLSETSFKKKVETENTKIFKTGEIQDIFIMKL